MKTLVIGLLLFIGVHSLRELRLRNRLINHLGEQAYRIVFSLISLTGLVLIVLGKSRADFTMIYEPAFELQFISHMLMLPAVILFVGGILPRSYMSWLLVHPMLLGTLLWGGAHLWANGDLASLLLFGGISLWAAMKFCSLSLTQAPPGRKPGAIWDITAIIMGLLLYQYIAEYHGHLFGIGISIV